MSVIAMTNASKRVGSVVGFSLCLLFHTASANASVSVVEFDRIGSDTTWTHEAGGTRIDHGINYYGFWYTSAGCWVQSTDALLDTARFIVHGRNRATVSSPLTPITDPARFLNKQWSVHIWEGYSQFEASPAKSLHPILLNNGPTRFEQFGMNLDGAPNFLFEIDLSGYGISLTGGREYLIALKNTVDGSGDIMLASASYSQESGTDYYVWDGDPTIYDLRGLTSNTARGTRPHYAMALSTTPLDTNAIPELPIPGKKGTGFPAQMGAT
jgi:hypothetical protein